MRFSRWKKVISCLLVVVLLLGPGLTVLAAPTSFNETTDIPTLADDELIRYLIEEYGMEQAPVLLQALKDLGLVDGSGQLRTHPILLGGESYSIEEIEELFAAPDVDLSQRIQIDDMEMALGELKRILEVERYIADHLATYRPDDIELTLEHIDSLLSLLDQAEQAGIPFVQEGYEVLNSHPTMTTSTATNGDYQDEVIVTLESIRTLQGLDKGTSTFYFELNQVQDVDVSFTIDIALFLGRDNRDLYDFETTREPGFGSLEDFDADTGRGIFTIPAGNTTGNFRLYYFVAGPNVQDMDIPNSYYHISVHNPLGQYYCGLTMDQYEERCVGDRETLDKFRNVYAARDSLVERYIHFHSFKNFDRLTVPDLNTSEHSDWRTTFKHEYNGGAYVGLKYREYSINTGLYKYDNNSYNPNDPPTSHNYPMYFTQAYQFGVLSSYELGPSDNQILETNAYIPGIYTTDQVIPFWIMYDNPGMTNHRLIISHPDTAMNSVSFHNGMIGTPLRFDRPSLQYREVEGTFGRYKYQDWGMVAHRYNYSTVITKDAVDAFVAEEAAGQPHTSIYIREVNDLYVPTAWIQNGYDEVPSDSPLLGMTYDPLPWNQEFSNAADVPIELVYARSDAFQEIITDKASYTVGDELSLRIPLVMEYGEADWIIDEAYTQEDLTKRVQASIGDRQIGRITDLDWIRAENGEPMLPLTLEGSVHLTQELFDRLQDADAEHEGKQLRVKIYYNRNTEPGALVLGEWQDFGMLEDTFTYLTVREARYIAEEELAVGYPESWPSGEAYVVSFNAPAGTVLTALYPPEATFATVDQFVWGSSDESVARIQQDGTIIPVGAGEVTFSLTALNNGVFSVTVQSEPITIDMSGKVSLIIPSFANQVLTHAGSDAGVFWQTNVMERAREIAGEQGTSVQDSHFHVELYTGELDENELATATPVRRWSSPGTSELTNATSFAIPAAELHQISTGYQPSYTVKVSVEHPEEPGVMLTARSYIIVKSLPVHLELERLSSQYVTDQHGEVEIRWSMEHFDTDNASEFEFVVTKNGHLLPSSVIVYDPVEHRFQHAGETADHVTIHGGSYRLNIDAIEGTSRLRDEYVVTIAAKNGLDDTWSYDSLYITAYNDQAFHMVVDGVSAGDRMTLDNNPRIRDMDSEQIVGLKRNILLQHDMSMNYQDHQLNPITDQFAWSSDDNGIAVINFKSYGHFANIDQFGYSSYQPKYHFALAGVGDGTTTIRAVHAQTGIEDTLQLDVNTLQDKLYLFQFYPKAETTIEYTNGDGQLVSVTSNVNGELAVYEENGIHSDVYVTSVFHGTTYTGVIDEHQLLSKEPDPAMTSLYPINILQLRQLAQVEAYLKHPDGRPYTGEITYRAGVYKNGNYAELAEIGNPGVIEQLGADGRLEILFDTTDFYSIAAGEDNAFTLSAKDHIEFIVELRFADDQYYPLVLMYDGDLSPIDRVALGEKNVLIKENSSNVPDAYMWAQYVQAIDDRAKTQIVDYTGKFGPNEQKKQIKLTADYLWWGQEVDPAATYVELYTHTGGIPQGQSYETFQYPFSDIWITRHVQIINEDTIWLKKSESGSLEYHFYDESGFRKSTVPPAMLINMIGVQKISESSLKDHLKQMRHEMLDQKGRLGRPSNNDRLLSETFLSLGDINMDMGPIQMQIYPTDDPAVYRTIMKVEVGSMPSTSDDGAILSFFDKQNFNYNIAPGAGDLFEMAVGTYLKDKKKAYETMNKSKYGDGAPAFAISGYYLGEMRYNAEYDYWQSVVLSGGFKAGGGFEYEHHWNMFAGPVPITFSLKLGAQAEVGFQTSVLYDEVPGYRWEEPNLPFVNDYVTTFRILAYVEAFGGIGFDYTVVAAKIGVFGRLSVENTNMWLNRDYLANSGDRVLYGNKLTLEGVVGIRVVLKILFISINHDFASFRYSHTWLFHHWERIEAYWNEHAHMPLTSANLDVAIASYIAHEGIDDSVVFQSITMEDRDYLAAHDRAWTAASPSILRAMSTLTGAADKLIQTNAYPYSNPDVAADGSMFIYMSDNNSVDVADTSVHWAERTVSGFVDRGPIVNDSMLQGFGDSNAQLAGEGDWIAAAWVRQMGQLSAQAGDELSSEEMMMMINSAEIMVSIYDGTGWQTTRLTDNKTPDLAPIVAVADGKVFVAYRSVYADDVNHPLDFTQHDSIQYRVYDPDHGGWSDEQTLYNGTSGTVMGMSAAALTDGTAAVAYVIDRDSASETMTSSDGMRGQHQEIVYAVIDTSIDNSVSATNWKTKGTMKNVQLTNDDYTNENPQLTAVRFADGEERFLLAWHSAKEGEFGSISDIRFAAVNGQGEPDGTMVDNLRTLMSFNELHIDPNFRFVKLLSDHNDLDHLSIIWRTAEYEQTDTTILSRDRLKSVKLAEDNGRVSLSGVLDIGAMPDYTQADTISAYASDPQGLSIHAILLGTTYTTDATQVGTVNIHPESEAGEEVPVVVANTVSAMYEMEETYRDQFNADEIILNPSEIVAGFDLPIIFNIVNQGVHNIDVVDITVGDVSEHFSIADGMPNTNTRLTFYYPVPSQVRDVAYTINVTYDNGATLSTSGMLYLDIPDVGIAKAGIRMEEADGLRKIRIPLFNQNDTRLEGSGRSVKLALYSSTEYIADNRVGSVLDISDPLSLSMIDAGAYLAQMTFDVRDYLRTSGESEISDSGIPLYARVWVEEADGSEVVEFFDFNNTADLTVVHLSHKYGVKDVLVTHELEHTDGRSRVSLTMQNMNMAPITNGNVWVQLLDADGEAITSRYVATNAAELLSFKAEEKKQAVIEFDQAGHRIRTMYFVESADAMDATLSAAAFSGVDLSFAPDQTDYQLLTNDLKRTQFVATASHTGATVTLLDHDGDILARGSGFVAAELVLEPDWNAYAVRVEPESASGVSAEYRFDVQNEQTVKPRLDILLSGDKHPNGEYASSVDVSLPAFDVDGYDIDRAFYRVGDANWTEVAYDGKSAADLTTVTEEGLYAISVKLLLQSGGEYTLHPVTFKVTHTDGDENSSSVVASSDTVIANGFDQSQITVTLRNANGRALEGRMVSLVADGGSSVTDAVYGGMTNQDGQTMFAVSNTVTGVVTYTAYDEMSHLALGSVQIRFMPGDPDASQSMAAASRSTVVADGTDVSEIKVTVKDRYGNRIGGRRVVLQAIDGSSVIAARNEITDQHGEASFTVSNTQVETVTYTAEDDASGLLLGTVNVHFMTGDVSVTRSSLAASHSEVIANGADHAVITVTLKDANDHALAGRYVVLKPDQASSVVNDVYNPTSAKGEAMFIVSNTAVEQVRYTAQDQVSGLTLGPVVVNFIPGAVDAQASSVDVMRSPIVANGRDQTTIKVIVRDALGHEISGEKVVLSATNGSSVITAVNEITDQHGEASFAVTNTVEEIVTYTVRVESSGTDLGTVQVRFIKDSSDGTPNPPVNPGKPRGGIPDDDEDEPVSVDEPGDQPTDDEEQEPTDRSLFHSGMIDIEALIRVMEEKLAATADWHTVFPDIQGHWAYDVIMLLMRLDVIQGFPDGSFKPDQSITRAEFAAMMVRLFMLEDIDFQPLVFGDLERHWACEAVTILAKHGIVNGYTDGSFRPDAPITREEMVVMLMRLMIEERLPVERNIAFVDLDDAGRFAQSDVITASKAGIINGYEDQTIRPKGFATRAETAMLLINLLNMEPRLKEVITSHDE